MSLPNLQELDLTGNEVILSPHFKPKVLASKKLKKLNGYPIKDYYYEQISVFTFNLPLN